MKYDYILYINWFFFHYVDNSESNKYCKTKANQSSNKETNLIRIWKGATNKLLEDLRECTFGQSLQMWID